jgi:hypothetical protein
MGKEKRPGRDQGLQVGLHARAVCTARGHVARRAPRELRGERGEVCSEDECVGGRDATPERAPPVKETDCPSNHRRRGSQREREARLGLQEQAGRNGRPRAPVARGGARGAVRRGDGEMRGEERGVGCGGGVEAGAARIGGEEGSRREEEEKPSA